MSMVDDLRDKAQDIMDNPEQREKIEQIAREKKYLLKKPKTTSYTTKTRARTHHFHSSALCRSH